MKILFIESEETFYMPVKTKIPKRWAYLVEIANYVSNKGNEVKVMDCLDPSISHAEILEEVAKNNYDLICFLMRIETVNSMLKLVPLIRKISPQTKLLTYGDAPCMFVNYIKKNFGDLDAIVEGGDWEVAICNYAKFINEGESNVDDIPGVTIKRGENWIDAKRCNGEKFTEWSFPDLENKICNSDLYLKLKDNEVTVSVSRGCPYNCKFCLAVKTFDKADRRKDPNEIVDFMEKYKDKVSTFKLFSPTFTYDEKWVEDLCNIIIQRNLKVQWVVTSRPDKLQNKDLLKLMSKAGCKRVAVGIETLDEKANKELKKFNNIENYKNSVKKMFNYANEQNITIKPLLMMGINGQNKTNIKETLNFLGNCGAKDIRIAAYSPRQLLSEEDRNGTITLEKINKMDKMTYVNYMPEELDNSSFLNLIYNTKKYNEL
ncbi:MAG: radical SAM protein [Clostridiales bacterium]|nr:radical SAM protein [Clostridiales bacterium]